ncbi:MAG: hypothetical protein JNL90_21140 [Planctomycetes bacterium]|nr:hypothetical protein [Planctomycetota bacterium]
MKIRFTQAALVGLGLAGISGRAHAAEILVTADITTSTTWTANNTYNLQQQIYVRPGATLTIQAGTLIISDTGVGGSLAVCNGAQIFANGTQEEPVIFTSKADQATWTGGDPKTGTWREAANEWGNLTIMGDGYISENATPGNVATPDAGNVAAMEGLILDPMNPTLIEYGGGNDDDDSGSISYLSLRYGGKVISLANELNGLSLGGIGRETDIRNVEIMNNVDDGVEIWGGTVNLRCLSVWNVGDDSVDIDQGYRGKIQDVLIVQGHSLNAAQGSGVGDNCFETDGAEQSDWQPVTTATIYNATVIGQPVDGDHATAWRDNARVQYRNSIFMDLGERLVSFDNVDGDGGAGYGFNGTLSWANTWTTDWNNYSSVNAPAVPTDFYKAQVDGKLAEIRDSVFFRNLNGAAYTEATARGVFDVAMNNVLIAGALDVDSPVTTLTRGAPVVKGGKTMLPVTFLDPRPANEALTSVDWAPADGFFHSARYRGAFKPGLNWLDGWTASQAFGMTPASLAWNDLENALGGTNGDPLLTADGDLSPGNDITAYVSNAPANAYTALIFGVTRLDLPFEGGKMVPFPNLVFLGLSTDANGELELSETVDPSAPSDFTFYVQFWVVDAGGPSGWVATNCLAGTTP